MSEERVVPEGAPGTPNEADWVRRQSTHQATRKVDRETWECLQAAGGADREAINAHLSELLADIRKRRKMAICRPFPSMPPGGSPNAKRQRRERIDPYRLMSTHRTCRRRDRAVKGRRCDRCSTLIRHVAPSKIGSVRFLSRPMSQPASLRSLIPRIGSMYLPTAGCRAAGTAAITLPAVTADADKENRTAPWTMA